MYLYTCNLIIMQATSRLVYDSTLDVSDPQGAEPSSDLVRSSKTRVNQDGRYEKEGKRWLRRKDNCEQHIGISII